MTSWLRVSIVPAAFGLVFFWGGKGAYGPAFPGPVSGLRWSPPDSENRRSRPARDNTPLHRMGPTNAAGADESGGKRHNELSLGRLRPGKDKLEAAVALYGSNYRRAVPDSDDVLAWVDARRGRVLRMEVSSEGIIESVTVSAIDSWLGEGGRGPQASLPLKMLVAGRGLSLGDPRERVLKLYGPPASTGPSTQDGRELELLFYTFDWAGSDVPQAMEVTCDRSEGRVVQITLAFPSL